ncbi:hypothetical protein, partial [Bradyrhizobium sp.]|uniref:hypothetical protein n=1 Tax=Bradyrhizobium sp. TaxID=376 RepID=UPI003C48D6C6
AWQDAGHISRNAEAIIVTTSVTPAVTEAVDVTVMRAAAAARPSMSPVKLAAFIVALALACVSAGFSIDGLTAIFAGAFWPVITMGAALEAGKLVAAAWLTEYWHSAPSLLRLVLVAMIAVLMSLNAVGVFGFLTRAHLEHMAAVDLALADSTAETKARLAIQGQTIADLDRRIAQIDAAIEESIRLGRSVGAMTISDQKRRDRADIVAARQREAQALAALQMEKQKLDAQRRRAGADVGPPRYLAELIGTPATDLERPVRLLTLALVAVLAPLAVALLLAAGARTRRMGSR